MTISIHLSGQESSRELQNLRRSILRERRFRKASHLSFDAAQAAVIIEFPSPESPRIA